VRQYDRPNTRIFVNFGARHMAGGKQFIAFPVGGGGLVEELIALAL
jgi:hypothetical protein